jgi:hypothetical protein
MQTSLAKIRGFVAAQSSSPTSNIGRGFSVSNRCWFVGVLFVVLVAPSVAAQDVAPVRVPLTVAVPAWTAGEPVDVVLTNTGSRGIVAWTLHVVSVLDSGERSKSGQGVDRYPAQAGARAGVTPVNDPRPWVLEPGASETTRVYPSPGTVSIEVVAACVIFDDGRAVGEEREIRRVFEHRDHVAASIRKWLPTYRLVADASSEQEAVDVLKEALVSLAPEDSREHREPYSMALQLAERAARGEEIRIPAKRLFDYLTVLREEAERR